jgi:hypothetical protein
MDRGGVAKGRAQQKIRDEGNRERGSTKHDISLLSERRTCLVILSS